MHLGDMKTRTLVILVGIGLVATLAIVQCVSHWGIPHHTTLVGQINPITSVAFSHQSALLAGSSYDRSFAIWDLVTHDVVAELRPGSSSAVTFLSFSPDGKSLVTTCEAGTTYRYDSDGLLVQKSSESEVASMVEVWDVASKTVAYTLPLQKDRVTCFAFTPDGQTLAFGTEDGNIKLWSMSQKRETVAIKLFALRVDCLAVSEDCSMIAAGGTDHVVALVDIHTRKEVRRLEGHTGSVSSVAFTPHANRVVSGSWDGTVKVWDVGTGILKDEHRFDGRVTAVSCSPQGAFLAAANRVVGELLVTPDGEIRIWDMESGKQQLTWTAHQGGVTCLAFSPSGKILATGGVDGKIRLWDIARPLDSQKD